VTELPEQVDEDDAVIVIPGDEITVIVFEVDPEQPAPLLPVTL